MAMRSGAGPFSLCAGFCDVKLNPTPGWNSFADRSCAFEIPYKQLSIPRLRIFPAHGGFWQFALEFGHFEDRFQGAVRSVARAIGQEESKKSTRLGVMPPLRP